MNLRSWDRGGVEVEGEAVTGMNEDGVDLGEVGERDQI